MGPREVKTIRELYDNHKDWMMDQLNNERIYCWAVRRCGYSEIGIEVLGDDGGRERYASHNGPDGKIYFIEDKFTDPDVAVEVKESTLLDILAEMDKVKKKPIPSFLKYRNEFDFVKGSYWDVFKAVFGFKEKSGDTQITL